MTYQPKDLMMKKLIVCLVLLCSYSAYAQNAQELRDGALSKCMENNEKEQCQCFVDELFNKYSIDELIALNHLKVSEDKIIELKDWFKTKPCGVDYLPFTDQAMKEWRDSSEKKPSDVDSRIDDDNAYLQDIIQNYEQELREIITDQCLKNENNTPKQCQCFVNEFFIKYPMSDLIELNNEEDTSSDRLQETIAWVNSKPCGVDYISPMNQEIKE